MTRASRAAKARRHAAQRRTARPQPDAPVPDWLRQLRQALFTATFPALDPHFGLASGELVVAERSVDDGQSLRFRETWRDPYTLHRMFTWHLALDPVSFVSVEPHLVVSAAATVRLHIAAQRPPGVPQRVPRRAGWAHERLGDPRGQGVRR